MKTFRRFFAVFFAAAVTSSVIIAGASASEGVAHEPAETLTMMSEAQYRAMYGEPKIFDNRPFTGREKLVYASDSVKLDPPLFWYTKVWVHRDNDGRTLPTRRGDDRIGYLHYAQRHNVISERPIKTAYEKNRPHVVLGTHLEYLAFVTDGASIRVTFRAIQEQATRSSDGAYVTQDGLPLGTITAYCDGRDVCPNFIN